MNAEIAFQLVVSLALDNLAPEDMPAMREVQTEALHIVERFARYGLGDRYLTRAHLERMTNIIRFTLARSSDKEIPADWKQDYFNIAEHAEAIIALLDRLPLELLNADAGQ